MQKKILIIGGTSGIGKNLAKLYAKENNIVFVTGRSIEKLIDLKNEFPQNIICFQHDISKDIEWNKIVHSFPKIDIAIISAGISKLNPNLSWEIEKEILDTNISGVVNLYQLLFKHFQSQGYGHLVGITSVAAVKGNRELPAYSASKAFQINYLEALRCKSIKENLNIYITDICPGFIETPMNNGEKMFWSSTTQKAANQIYEAINLKKKKAFIAKRWRLIYYIFKILPNWIIEKF